MLTSFTDGLQWSQVTDEKSAFNHFLHPDQYEAASFTWFSTYCSPQTLKRSALPFPRCRGKADCALPAGGVNGALQEAALPSGT